jgi:ubiquinone/menaquinone biosynthesis C-methylase UbiE
LYDAIRPLNVSGEELTKIFPEGYFDIVSCNNALDHCADPLSVICEMVLVCRDDGWVHIFGSVNVGVLKKYHRSGRLDILIFIIADAFISRMNIKRPTKSTTPPTQESRWPSRPEQSL